MKRDEIVDWIEEQGFDGDEMLLADGLEDAFIGVVRQGGSSVDVACYDVDRCIDTLIENDGLEHEEAWDHFNFNVIGGYVGPTTPIFLYRFNPEDFND